MIRRMVTITCEFGSDLLLQDGPIIRVRVGWDRNFNPDEPGVPNIPAAEYRAILDTGADYSAIDRKLAMRLKLPIVGEGAMDSTGGAANTNIHDAIVHVPQLGFTQHGQFHAVTLTRGRHILLGRKFLQHFTMTYEGRTGTVTLSKD
jgi:predicted aspartyl protease